MQKSFRLLAILALIGLAAWGWWIFFPSPERAIRSRLKALAEINSFEKEGTLAKAYNAQKAADFFTPDVTIKIDVTGYPPQSVEGRDNLLEALMGARQFLRSLKIEFLDVNVAMEPDEQAAIANLTGRIIMGNTEPIFQELNFKLKKVAGKWLIYDVQTVKTLSQAIALPPDRSQGADGLVGTVLLPIRR